MQDSKENNKKLYKELCVKGVHDNGEDVYISDGVYLTRQGDFICNENL